jgi:hypothetical protein
MKTIRLQQVIDSVVTRAGIDPSLPEAGSLVHGRLNSGQASMLVDYIQSACLEAWTFFDWPEIHLTEARTPLGNGFTEGGYTYESDYVGTIAYIGRAVEGSPFDQPVWRIKRITTTESGESLNVDTAVDVTWDSRVEATYSEDSQNASADEIPYIYLSAEGLSPIGDVTAVWSADPAGLANKLRYSVTADRILITDTAYSAGPVYVEFALPVPEFSMTEYTSEQWYPAGYTVFHTPSGDCYRSLVPCEGESPVSKASWQKQAIPFFLGSYIKERVLGDLYMGADKDQKALYQFQRAEGLLLRAMDDAWLRKGEVRTWTARFN